MCNCIPAGFRGVAGVGGSPYMPGDAFQNVNGVPYMLDGTSQDANGIWSGNGLQPFPNYYNLPSTVLNYPGPVIINHPNSAYRFNPSFDGLYAHNTQTNPYLNYAFDIVNGLQHELTQFSGGGYTPFNPWGGNLYNGIVA
jgi:hypothetical protein